MSDNNNNNNNNNKNLLKFFLIIGISVVIIISIIATIYCYFKKKKDITIEIGNIDQYNTQLTEENIKKKNIQKLDSKKIKNEKNKYNKEIKKIFKDFSDKNSTYEDTNEKFENLKSEIGNQIEEAEHNEEFLMKNMLKGVLSNLDKKQLKANDIHITNIKSGLETRKQLNELLLSQKEKTNE